MWIDDAIEALKAYKKEYAPDGCFIDRVEPVEWTHYIRIKCGFDNKYYDYKTKTFFQKAENYNVKG